MIFYHFISRSLNILILDIVSEHNERIFKSKDQTERDPSLQNPTYYKNPKTNRGLNSTPLSYNNQRPVLELRLRRT